MKTFVFHGDPGHAWLEVTNADLKEVGLSHKDFTCYSYVLGERLFLEEDCDAGTFLNAYAEKFGKNITFDEKIIDIDHPIRGLARIGEM